MVDFDSEVDYYQVLQVHPSAHQEVIKRAFRTIVGLLQTHPDLGGSHEAAIRLNKAYQVLSDTETRKAYDEARARRAKMVKRTEKAWATQKSAQQRAGFRLDATDSKHSNGAHHSNGNGMQLVYCPRCGARNRLPKISEHRLAICGKCRSPLFSMRRGSTELLLPGMGLKLPVELAGRLINQGEICLKRAQMPTNRLLLCLRCDYQWLAGESEKLPAHCPRCRSSVWSGFRLFQCRHCANQFTSDDLTAHPYHIFKDCPSCHKFNWHAGNEKKPLSWLLRKIAGVK